MFRAGLAKEGDRDANRSAQRRTEYIAVAADPPSLGGGAHPGDEELITRSDRGVCNQSPPPQDGRDDLPIPEHPHPVPLAMRRGPSRHRQSFRNGHRRVHIKEPRVANGPADPHAKLNHISRIDRGLVRLLERCVRKVKRQAHGDGDDYLLHPKSGRLVGKICSRGQLGDGFHFDKQSEPLYFQTWL